MSLAWARARVSFIIREEAHSQWPLVARTMLAIFAREITLKIAANHLCVKMLFMVFVFAGYFVCFVFWCGKFLLMFILCLHAVCYIAKWRSYSVIHVNNCSCADLA